MKINNVKGKRIFVGLSGGVDSSVTATLLMRAGAHVIGVFIKGWYPKGMPCTWANDRRDAMRVSAKLHIPFYTLDASKAYKRGVIDYMLSEYAIGRTPNPDVMCNREVKFGEFASFAFQHGADFIATGHYARIDVSDSKMQLLRGIDKYKDQSYFLWAVPKEILSKTIFPLGGLHKTEVRTMAQKFSLPVAEKKDSQGVCFLGDVSVEEFLKKEFSPERGKAVNESGQFVGEHEGAVLYTLGERVALLGNTRGPWYVLAKDIKENELVVTHNRFSNQTQHSKIALSKCNWFENASKTTEVQYRYHGPKVSGSIVERDGVYIYEALSGSGKFVPGQSLVAYAGEQCIGGGIIETS
ncbi:MAG TPA: tRNA 2-thiouridine(34) synthase MnmA [Candidatus Kaiserbacteria bacterium]|nr:tRNA 2-thiouridine(34) synthase MnmA [Candidatus Kaiserbacteria bacterium]